MFLVKKRIKPEIENAKPASSRKIKKFEKIFGLVMPEDLKYFYQEVSNGYDYYWRENGGFDDEERLDEFLELELHEMKTGEYDWERHGELVRSGEVARFILPNIKELIEIKKGWDKDFDKLLREDQAYGDIYDDKFLKASFEYYSIMKDSIPIWWEDKAMERFDKPKIAVNCKNGKLYWHKYDWYDDQVDDPVEKMVVDHKSFYEFFMHLAKYCFIEKEKKEWDIESN